MKNFKNRDEDRGGFGGNRGGRDSRGQRGDDKPVFYGKSRGGDRSTDREQRMFKAVCSDCKKSCEVPFKPSSDKPVFCRDCFSAKRDRETREYKAGLASGEPKKFGQGKPVSYGVSVNPEVIISKTDESVKKQLDEMNSRIDKLTLLLEKMMEAKNEVVAVSQVKVASSIVPKSSVKTLLKNVTPKSEPVKKVVAKKVVTPAKKTVVTKVVAKKAIATTAKKVIVKKVVVAKKAVTKKTK